MSWFLKVWTWTLVSIKQKQDGPSWGKRAVSLMAMNGAVTIRKIWKSCQAIKESEHHKYEDMNAELEQHAMHCFPRMNDYFEWSGAIATLLPPAEIKARKSLVCIWTIAICWNHKMRWPRQENRNQESWRFWHTRPAQKRDCPPAAFPIRLVGLVPKCISLVCVTLLILKPENKLTALSRSIILFPSKPSSVSLAARTWTIVNRTSA